MENGAMNYIEKENVLAKSTGISLYDHSHKVYELSKHLLTFFENSEKFSDIIKYASLLHDIGKSTFSFQEFLRNGESENKIEYFHNEIGWAFVMSFLNLDERTLINVSNLIYWHHGIISGREQNSEFNEDIISKLNDADIVLMKEQAKYILGEDIFLEEQRERIKTPPYLSSDWDGRGNIQNQELILLRSVLIASDRFVSEHENKNIEDLIKIFDGRQIKSANYEFLSSSYSNTDRFAEQCSIVRNVEKTTIIKAPAGFGKTLIGLLWSQKNNKKTIWVCPRNTVAKSVYTNILQEMEAFNVKINIELFLSGEVKESNHNSRGFDSDIIITNIDNFLKPSVDNSTADQAFFINSVNVVFDEYHELVQETALFSLFLYIMHIRNVMAKSETLLLSATPIKLNHLWDAPLAGKVTKILPDEKTHYPAAHSKEYEFNVISEPKFADIKYDTLVVFNSIKNAQKNKDTINNCDIIHSLYEEDAKNHKFTSLLETYGKKSNRKSNKNNLIGTHIVQASLDVSFNSLYESVLSPESTLQRIGRCNRWGDYENISKIFIFKNEDRGETIMRRNLYNEELTNKWFSFLIKQNRKLLTLDHIYEFYNQFGIMNDKLISCHVKKFKNESIKNIDTIHPIKRFGQFEKNDIMKAGGNKLRSNGNELFFICKNTTTNEYTDPFSTSIRNGVGMDFKEDSNTTNQIKKEIEKLATDSRFTFGELVKKKHKFKKLNSDQLKKNAKFSNMPYIRFDVVYDKTYGIIDKRLFSEIK